MARRSQQDNLAAAHPAVALLAAFLLGPFAYVYTLEFRRMGYALAAQLIVLAFYAGGVTLVFAGGFRITSLAGGSLDQALVATPLILLGAGVLALATNGLVAIDLTWRVAAARRRRRDDSV